MDSQASDGLPTIEQRPSKRTPLQFGLKHLLALPIPVALLAIAFREAGPIGLMVVLVLFAGLAFTWVLGSPVARVLGVCFVVFMYLVVLSAPEARRPNPHGHCGNNIRQLGLAMQIHHERYGHFPPAHSAGRPGQIAPQEGRPMHSWRVALLPHLEESDLFDQYDFDEPWDGPNNRKLADKAPYNYRCPLEDEKSPGTTSYLAIVGEHTAWPGSVPTKLQELPDGSSNTLLLVETHRSGVLWTEPRDLHVTQMARGVNAPAGQGISGPHHGANVVFADGSVHFLSPDVAPEVVEALITIDDGRKLNGDEW